MPLPERPNLGEFTPAAESSPERKRAGFRFRVVPITLLGAVTLGCLGASAFVAMRFVEMNPMANRARFAYLTNAEWFYRRATLIGQAAISSVLFAIAALACILAIRALTKERWTHAVAWACLLGATLVLVVPVTGFMVPLLARMLSSAVHRNHAVE